MATWLENVRERAREPDESRKYSALSFIFSEGSWADWRSLPLSTLEAIVALLDAEKEEG